MSLSSMPFHERCVVLLDEYPWSVFCRVGIGFVMPPLFSRLCNNEYHVWCVTGLFLGILVSLRLVTAILRKLVPFSSEVRVIWAERRQLAKRFDSYQWQKLFWLGVGMACYAVVSERVGGVVDVLILLCLIGGGIGVLTWVRRSARIAVLR